MKQFEPPLRGSGSQNFSQDNGEFSSSSTTYSSGSVGQIQGDAMRRLWGEGGMFQFSSTLSKGSNVGGNFAKVSLSSAYASYAGPGSLNYYYISSDNMSVKYVAKIPVYRYSLSGDGDSFSLIESQEFIDVATREEYDSDAIPDSQGARNVKWDSSWGAPTANEIRPVNTAVRYFIRAR